MHKPVPPNSPLYALPLPPLLLLPRFLPCCVFIITYGLDRGAFIVCLIGGVHVISLVIIAFNAIYFFLLLYRITGKGEGEVRRNRQIVQLRLYCTFDGPSPHIRLVKYPHIVSLLS